MTKGLKAYEALLFAFDDYSDSLSEIENDLDEEIESLSSEAFLETVQEIKYTEERVSEQSNKKVEDVNVHLPVSLAENLTESWGIGYHIGDAVDEIHASVWDDRLDRMETKRDLIRVLDGADPETDLVEDILEGESYVEEEHVEMMKYLDEDFWADDDLSLDLLMERGEDIPQGKKRITALEIALSNSEEEYDEGELKQVVSNIFDDVSTSTQHNYIDQIDLSARSDKVHVDLTPALSAATLGMDTDDYSEYITTQYDLAAIDEENVIEGYYTEEEALDALQQVLDDTRTARPDNPDIEEAYDAFRNFVIASKKVIQGEETKREKAIKGPGIIEQ